MTPAQVEEALAIPIARAQKSLAKVKESFRAGPFTFYPIRSLSFPWRGSSAMSAI
ncbi:MAG: hypothetical protein CM15mP74_31440 [Halieaceae bacterium]|nr:MAG: hypothetical protein CM15mP74_31440 [Halieaceae bacterium]